MDFGPSGLAGGLNDQPIQLQTDPAWRAERARFKPGASGGQTVEGHGRGTGRTCGGRKRQRKGEKNVAFIPSLEGVVDFSAFGSNLCSNDVISLDLKADCGNLAPDTFYDGAAFGLKSRPGFIHFPGALSQDMQVKLCDSALNEYCFAPHATNVDAHLHRPENQRPRLAWASLGYHFDWTGRTYRDELYSSFPADLAALSAKFARRAGSRTFKAQAAIVNYYKPGGNMGAHVDDSEDDSTNPVVSLSLGLPAIFLVGTHSKEDAPVPVVLRGGDVMLLSGKSRLCFHGIAGVFPGRLQECSEVCPGGGFGTSSFGTQMSLDIPQERRKRAEAFMEKHRVNMNVRQVLLDNHTKLLPKTRPDDK